MNQTGIDAEALCMDPGKWYHVELDLVADDDRQVLTIHLDEGESVQGPDLLGFRISN